MKDTVRAEDLIQAGIAKKAEWEAKLQRQYDRLAELEQLKEAAFVAEDESQLVAIAEERLKVNASIEALKELAEKAGNGITHGEIEKAWNAAAADHNARMEKLLKTLNKARQEYFSALCAVADLQGDTLAYFRKLNSVTAQPIYAEVLGLNHAISKSAFEYIGGNPLDYWDFSAKFVGGMNLHFSSR